MAISKCNMHGEQVSTLLSSTVFHAFCDAKNSEEIYRVREIIGGNEGWGQSFFVKREELEALGYFSSKMVSEDKLDQYDQFVSSLTPVCSACVAEWVDCNAIEIVFIQLVIE